MPKGICPDCDGEVQINADVITGQIVDCDDCGAELEVSGLDPVELDIVEDTDFVDDDYEDDDEY